MEYEQMRAMEKTHCCAQCGGELVTIWDQEYNASRLCCGIDHSHNGFQQKLSPQKALQRGKADEVIQPGAQKDLEERARRSQTALSLLPKEDIATHRALSILEIGKLVVWADLIGLNASLGHVCLYYGKPYRTVNGLYYLNNKREKPYRIGVRPMTKEEKATYMVEEANYAYIAKAYLDGVELPDDGIGFVTSDEISAMAKEKPNQPRSPVVHEHPQRMAEKRAEWQLLNKLIPVEVKE